MHLQRCFGIGLLSTTLSVFAQVQRQDHNQNVKQNNGTLNQYNITVQNELKAAATKAGQSDEAWDRVLLPGKQANPASPCDSPENTLPPRAMPSENSLRVYMGGGLSRCSGESCNIIVSKADQLQEQKLLWLERKNGVLLVHAKLFTRDNKIAVELDGSKPYVNSHVVAFTKRPSTSEITVVNESDEPILHISYLNKNSIRVTGLFYAPDFHSPTLLKIDDEAITQGHNVMVNPCLGNASHTAIFLTDGH